MPQPRVLIGIAESTLLPLPLTLLCRTGHNTRSSPRQLTSQSVAEATAACETVSRTLQPCVKCGKGEMLPHRSRRAFDTNKEPL